MINYSGVLKIGNNKRKITYTGFNFYGSPSPVKLNNLSLSIYSNAIANSSSKGSPTPFFILGDKSNNGSKLNSGDIFASRNPSSYYNKYDGYMTQEFAGDNDKILFSISYLDKDMPDIDMNAITLQFDKYMEQYPRKIYLQKSEYEKILLVDNNDDPTVTVIVNNSPNGASFSLEEWTRPEMPMVINSATLNLKLPFGVDYIKQLSLNDTAQNVEDPIIYGLVSNSGNLTFVDTTGEIRDLFKQNINDFQIKLQFYCNQSSIGEFIGTEWQYNSDDNTVSCTLQDNLTILQDAKVDVGWGKVSNYQTMLELFKVLKDKTKELTGLEFEDIKPEFEQYLDKMKLTAYSLTENLWNIWNDFCLACMSVMLINQNGKLELKRRGY